MIEVLAKEVENWSLDSLIAYFKQRYKYSLSEMSDEELQSRYKFQIALEEDKIEEYLKDVERSHEADELLDERR